MLNHVFCGKFSSWCGFCALILLLPTQVSAQATWAWAEGAGAGSDQRGHAIAADANGNSYSTGYIKGSGNDFGPNMISSAGGDDIFLAKYDANGNNVWVKRAGGSGDDIGHDVAIDASGNIYVCGEFQGTATFFGSPNIVLTSSGNTDAFVAKYNSSGDVLWAKKGGSGGRDEALSIVTDGLNVYVTGFFQSSITFGSLGALTSAGGDDVFVVSYNASAGTENWAVRGGSTANDHGEGIAVDGSGVYVGGYYDQTCSFQNHAGTLTNNGNSDIFLVKYDLTGTTGLWKRRAGGAAHDEGTSVEVNGSFVYVGGFFSGTMSLYDTGPAVATISSAAGEDACLVQYNATSGNYNWIRSENGTANERSYDISVNPQGVIYTTGYFEGSLPMGSGPSVSANNKDIFVTTWSPSGVFQYGLVGSGSSEEEGFGISAVDNFSAYITGYVKSSTVVFGSHSIGSVSNEDICFAKLGCTVVTANAGSDQTVCSSTATFAGNSAGPGTGTWTLISGTGTITSPNSPTSGITGLAVGANVFRWTIMNGFCGPTMDDVTITRDASPTTSAAGPDQNVCVSSATLAGNAPAIGTGLWTLISGTGTITTPSSPTSGVTGLSVGPNIFQWTITNGVCPSSTDQVTIIHDALPTTAAAGTDQTICSSSATLAGNTAVVGSGLWTLISGTGTITTPTSPTSGVTGLSVGPNVFEWTISNGTCPSSADQVTITRDPVPTISSAGTDQTLCSSTATLAGNTAAVGNGLWTLISGTGTITTPTSPTSGITGLSVGPNIFEWTISNGTCPSSSDQVTIIVDALPTTSAAGTDQTICSSSATLAGNTAVVGNGLWTLISGTGTITTPSSPTSGVNGLSVGANVFEWTITNGTCPSSSDQVTITRDAIPSPANAGIDTILCTNTVSLNGNVPTTGTGTWTLSSGSGTIVSPFSPTTTVLALGTGVNEFQWTISNGVCPSLHDTVIAEVDGIPTTANAGADQVICSSSATLSGNTIVTGSGTWSLISGNGVITNTALPNSTISGMTPGMHSFEWRAINGTCPASVDTVVITVDQNPTTAAAGADTTLCSSTDTLSANTALVGTGNWTLVSGSGVIDNPFSPITAITGLGTGTNIFSWTISNGTCPSSSDQVAIVQDVEPSVSVAGADHNRCFDQDTLNGNVPLSGAGLWTVISGGANLVSPLLPVCAVNDLTAGVNIFEWKISNGTCPSSADTVHIVYNEAPSPAAAGSDILACENNVTLQAQTPLVGGGVWDPIGGSPPLADSLNPNASISLAPGTWFYAWTVTNGFCVSPTDTLSITVYSLPSTALAGNDQLIHTSFVTLNAEPADTGTGTWTFVQGSGSIENIHDPFTRVTNLSPGVNILRWTTSNGVCPESSDDVHIESLPLIVPEGYSPNGDGVNDNFEISGLLEYNAVSLEVFNRWGNVVFVSADYRNNWNGTGRNGETLPDDIYYYILRADEGIVFTGFVAIKRSVQ